jgi:hypothetical protein
MVATATIGSEPQYEDSIAIPTSPVGIARRDMPVGLRHVPAAHGGLGPSSGGTKAPLYLAALPRRERALRPHRLEA